jgi:hypothetical protein
MFGLTLRSKFPPPTENTSTPITRIQPARPKPADNCGLPSLVVDSCREFGNVVGRSVSFDSCDLSEIVHRMRRIRRTAPQHRSRTAGRTVGALRPGGSQLSRWTQHQAGPQLRGPPLGRTRQSTAAAEIHWVSTSEANSIPPIVEDDNQCGKVRNSMVSRRPSGEPIS